MACNILSWNIPALWCLDIKSENNICSFCKNNNMDNCDNCDVIKRDDDNCTINVGNCGCHFHKHCIKKWLDTNDTCPVHLNKWVTKEEIIN
jgi:hypothetical protein